MNRIIGRPKTHTDTPSEVSGQQPVQNKGTFHKLFGGGTQQSANHNKAPGGQKDITKIPTLAKNHSGKEENSKIKAQIQEPLAEQNTQSPAVSSGKSTALKIGAIATGAILVPLGILGSALFGALLAGFALLSRQTSLDGMGELTAIPFKFITSPVKTMWD